jgi:hypothetical protein
MQVRRSAGGGPFAHVIYLKREEIDKMCEDALRVAKLLPNDPAPINIEGFIENHLGSRLDFATDLGADVLGFTFFSPKGKPEVIGVSPSLDEGTKVSERRIRATLAHEAGHGLIHPILFMEDGVQQRFLDSNIDLTQRRILCRKNDINPNGKYDGRWWEFQANCAIGGFLLPKRLVSKCVTHLTKTVGLLGGQILEPLARAEAEALVAETFEVNPVVARIRLAAIFPEQTHPEL